MHAKGLTTLLQIFYWSFTFHLSPNRFTVLVFFSVSTAHVFLLHISLGLNTDLK